MKNKKYTTLKAIIRIIFVNLFIIAFFILQYISTGPVKHDELYETAGVIDSVVITHSTKHDHITIKIDGISFTLYEMNNHKNVNFGQIISEIKAGDEVELTYFIRYNFFYKYNVIIDLNVNDTYLQTIDDYNEYYKDSDSFWIKFFIIVEIINLLYVVFCIWLNYKEIKKYVYKTLRKLGIIKSKNQNKKRTSQSGDG